jgi:acyl-coenzyme A thioesterase PaaI-like protein
MALDFISPNLKTTLTMRAFGFFKIPLLFMTSPKVLELSDRSCRVQIPLRKIVKNHLGSMYFGALAIGADTCVGMLAFEKIKKSNKPVQLVFKDFTIQFLKRAEGATVFVCDAGIEIQELIDKTIASGERQHRPIPGKALVGDVVVAEFQLTLSLKVK